MLFTTITHTSPLPHLKHSLTGRISLTLKHARVPSAWQSSLSQSCTFTTQPRAFPPSFQTRLPLEWQHDASVQFLCARHKNTLPYALRRSYTTSSQTPSAASGGKFKTFMKKYGYVGIGVYFGLSAIDLGLTMAVISVKGADKVKNMEDWVLTHVKRFLGMDHTPDTSPVARGEEKPSWTSLFLIAYSIHKTLLLPVRLSLTAIITPPLVKRLRALGWIHKKLK